MQVRHVRIFQPTFEGIIFESPWYYPPLTGSPPHGESHVSAKSPSSDLPPVEIRMAMVV